MTVLLAILAAIILISPVTNLVGTAAQVVQTADEVQDWRLKGCPERRLDHTVVYKCQTPTPAPKPKKHVAPKVKVAPPIPQPPVYIPPPLPEVPAEPAPSAWPDKPPPAKYDVSVQWVLDHLVGLLLTFAAFGVIGHGLRRIYRMWKGLE